MKALSISTLFAAASGFLILFVAPHVLSGSELIVFQALWGFFFTLTGLIDGLQHEVTRSVATAAHGSSPKPTSSFLLQATEICALVIVLATVAAGPWWHSSLAPELHPLWIGVFALAVGVYALQATLLGALSGLGLWGHYSVLIAVDQAIRLCVLAGALVLHPGLGYCSCIIVCGPISCVRYIICVPVARQSMRAACADSPRLFVRRALWAIAASGATAALVNGFAPALRAWGVDPNPAFIMAFIVIRAPLIMPALRFQAPIISRLSHGALSARLGLIAVVCLVYIVACGVVVPSVMPLLWGPAYTITPAVACGCALAALAQCGLFLSGSVALARAHHGLYCLGWALAAAIALAGLHVAMVAPLILGPIVGIAIHIMGIRSGRSVAPVFSSQC